MQVTEVEGEVGARSTWFLMTRSAFYNLASREGDRAIARLRELGGRIAHHAVWPDVDLDERFEPVVAWHNPDPEYMSRPIDGVANVMTAPWFDPDHYRSDSNARWRHGCPHEQLARAWLRVGVVEPLQVTVDHGDGSHRTGRGCASSSSASAHSVEPGSRHRSCRHAVSRSST